MEKTVVELFAGVGGLSTGFRKAGYEILLANEIDKSISNVINAQAKANGYDLVLAKGAVLSGGVDITDQIAKQVK